ncbi:MAG TPA: right-handed parallel beta-helix repeat-containing protein [Micromonosporaceae bacterium]|nr:right-handed parallel beta-helix repeat-containing protein [Micromonosporaceae bacterium]
MPRQFWRSPIALAAGVILAVGSVTVVAPSVASAAESSPVGWASQNGGTSGGGGSSVTVSTATALKSALLSATSQTVRVNGIISISGMYKVASNKTVLGVGANSGISGGGLTLSKVNNVIIRNLVFRNAADDSINVEQGTTNVWIDHNDLSAGNDGLADIKRGSDFITVSWNKFHHHDKTALLGHSDGNSSQDLGHLRVTYHHNWFDATTQRHPRVRFGNPVHVYNNYYRGNGGYGVASTCNAGVLVEKNYFEGVKSPVVTQTGDSPQGNVRLADNYLTGSGAPQSRNPDSVRGVPYAYTADAAAAVKAVVMGGAGTGKI